MTDYVGLLTQLTNEEQAIYRLAYRERRHFRRLERIKMARELIGNVIRAKKSGAPLADVPLDGWKIDRTGYTVARPRPQRKPPPESIGQRGGARGGPRELPTGVERNTSGRVRAVCFMKDRSKISLGTFDATPEQIALAGRMAQAARDARDAGGDAGACQAAALLIWQQEGRSYAAD